MARYGKRKFSAGSSTRRVKRRTVRRPASKTVRKMVAKRRYTRRFKRSVPRPLISYGRLPKVSYGSFQATWVITPVSLSIPAGTGGKGVAVGSGSTGISTQVPKGYDRMAAMYEQCRIYKSKCRIA
eukprot:2007335-Pleurochrysis_carterae.AAC.2